MINMDFTYLLQPPSKWTFDMSKLKDWLESYCAGNVLNLFGGKTRLKISKNYTEISNDIDIEMPTDYHLDAIKFVENWSGNKFDTIILDPPYNWRKAKEKYENRMIGQYPQLKDKLLSIINKNAIVISFGYDTVGMSKSRGFEKIAICLICHGGDHHDTICLVERYGNEIHIPKILLGTLYE